MWDDVIIGKLPERRVCGARSHHIHKNISINSQAYWISDLVLGLGMTVYRDTPEGKKIEKLLEKEGNVQGYLTTLVLKHVPDVLLIIKIEQYGQERYQEGRRSKVDEFRACLNL